MTAQPDDGVCVFLIGMRVNRWWKVHKWWPVAMAMPRMLKELEAHPELGCLGGHQWIGNPTILLQYWKSFDALERYATTPEHAHLPAWRQFNRRVAKNADVGVWHETYRVTAGNFECVYVNMPPFGLGKATRLVPAAGRLENAPGRMTP
ncbi:MAG TPA: DUF4188 domain-containing protein [Thermoanaerobaculia bacterium]|nr:DUF4188 domain-containing protein [Thermoanaerobaculia bacterium]